MSDLFLVPLYLEIKKKMGLIKQLVIKNILIETADTKTFILEPSSLDDVFPYQAGQFLTLVFSTKNGEERRSFSISSSAEFDEPLSITVKRIDNGAYSRLLFDKAIIGDTLHTIGASGFFILPQNIATYKQVFFFAAGSGITPVFSLIKALLHSSQEIKVVLIYSNKNIENTIFYTELNALQIQFSQQFKIEFLFSTAVNLTRARLSKWLINILLKEYQVANNEETLFYLCGPFDYMRMTSIALIAHDVPEQNIHKEDFVPLKLDLKELPPDIKAHFVSININGKQHDIAVQYPDTILKAAKKAGLQMPYSCEAGRCGTCVAKCLSGKVWMSYNEVLMDDEIAKDLILTCTGYPIEGNVSIQI